MSKNLLKLINPNENQCLASFLVRRIFRIFLEIGISQLMILKHCSLVDIEKLNIPVWSVPSGLP